MILEFLPSALDAYKVLKSSDPSLALKVKATIKDTLEHPTEGAGLPVQLTGAYSGIWMRKLSATDEMYYVFDDTKLIVISFSFIGASHSGGKSGFSLQAFTQDEYKDCSGTIVQEMNFSESSHTKSVITFRRMLQMAGLLVLKCMKMYGRGSSESKSIMAMVQVHMSEPIRINLVAEYSIISSLIPMRLLWASGWKNSLRHTNLFLKSSTCPRKKHLRNMLSIGISGCLGGRNMYSR